MNGCTGKEDGSKHDGTYEDFIYHISQRHSENLNYILGGWDTKTKIQFVLAHPELEDAGCVVWQ